MYKKACLTVTSYFSPPFSIPCFRDLKKDIKKCFVSLASFPFGNFTKVFVVLHLDVSESITLLTVDAKRSTIKIPFGGDRTDTPTDILPEGSASCVQSFDDSLDFAIRMTYRISLRSSSLWEPRHPLLKVV